MVTIYIEGNKREEKLVDIVMNRLNRCVSKQIQQNVNYKTYTESMYVSPIDLFYMPEHFYNKMLKNNKSITHFPLSKVVED